MCPQDYPDKPKVIIVVNRHFIAHNKKESIEERRPVFSVKQSGRRVRYGYGVKFSGEGKLVYRPDKPLSCGATAWLEVVGEIHIEDEMTHQEALSIL